MRAFYPRTSKLLDGYSAEVIADWLKVHVTTARRYKRGEEPSHAANLVLELRMTGNLEVVDPSWTGWRLHGGRLFAPGDNTGLTPGEVMATDYWRALARSYQADRRFPLQANWIEQTWEPAKEIA